MGKLYDVYITWNDETIFQYCIYKSIMTEDVFLCIVIFSGLVYQTFPAFDKNI